MNKPSQQELEQQFPIVLVMFATLLGLIVRIVAPMQASFPLNDGGLFYVMIRDIQQNGYALPTFTSYNFADLPFAYPPLAFYLTALLADITKLDLLTLLRILPAIVSAATVPAFYLLARQLLPDRLTASIAAICFALIPRGFEWLIMGGGITRSFGLLLALLTMQAAVQLFKTGQPRFIPSTLAWGALLVATHPEATLQTAIMVLISYFFFSRTLKGMLHSALVAAGILALTSPWWWTVVQRHGFSTLMAASQAAQADSINLITRLVIIFRFEFTNEQFLQIFGALGLIGLVISLAERKYFLPIWLLLLPLLEPRSALLYAAIPLVMLTGYALAGYIFPLFSRLSGQGHDNTPLDTLNSRTVKWFLGVLIIFSVMSAYNLAATIQSNFTLTQPDQDAFQWVKVNTPPGSEFLILTGQHHLRDAVSEWFPVLAERRSQATVFGYEWVPDGRFGERIEAYQTLQACLYKDSTCLNEWNRQTGANFSYVYLWNPADPKRYPLGIYLEQDNGYELVFQNESSMIFHKTK